MGGVKVVLSLLMYLLCSSVHFSTSLTDPNDAATLLALKDQWQHTPPSWRRSQDPCGQPWEGVTCNGSRVTILSLSAMGLIGGLTGDIGGLTELIHLDLAFNPGLTGPLSPKLGDLKKLNILILAGCGFSDNIPPELGNLTELTFFRLNSNNFTGVIPPSLGNLLKVQLLDFSDNQISGPIPVSTPSAPGLDLLVKTKHFHFNKNKLSGHIPPKLFSSEMEVIHVLFDGNQLTGRIPSTLGLVTSLENLRLDRNFLEGVVPSNLNNLTQLVELNLGHNKLTGPLPNLTGIQRLNNVDLSNNLFDESEAPEWFTTIESLTTLVIEKGSLQGLVPQELFSAPMMQQVRLKNNSFNGTLDMGVSISQQLQLVDFTNNEISELTVGTGYKNTLRLIGNPVCTSQKLSNSIFCQLHQPTPKPYSTTLVKCGSKECPQNLKFTPQSCECACPYQGTMYFRAPSFLDLTNASKFQDLEKNLREKLDLTPGSVSLQNLTVNSDEYIQLHLDLFPSTERYFNRTEVQRIGLGLSRTFDPPPGFGPYYFIAEPYPFPDLHRRASNQSGLIAGIAGACAFLVLVVVGVSIYAIKQKARAERAIGLSRPFASWSSTGKDTGAAPQLKGTRCFSYDELKKCTNNFSGRNEIGSGGYGKVYRGVLSDGQQVAIKRAQQGSKQGGNEFKTEIELLSRVHHKNLVGLLGFCFEQGEQMLVYEFMPNGSLKESLSGKSGIYLDWKRRLRIALSTARGLAYLHDLANPPIIHRDVKSTNILLDENLTAKVADFGLCKPVSDIAKGHVSTQVKGTMGYLDPEYYMTQQLTEKSDVYSFGIVLLELVTAKLPIEKGKYIVREVQTLMDKNNEDFCGLKEIIDPVLRNDATPNSFVRFVELAMRCVEDSSSNRPSMSEVVKEIETILHSDGTDTNSASSIVTDFVAAKGSPKHPYDALTQKDGTDNESFDCSDGVAISMSVEPK